MADVIFNSFKAYIMDGTIDLDADVVKVALVTDSYSPDQDAHEAFDDLSGECTGSGYTSGGTALAGTAVTIDDTDNEGVWDATNHTFSSINVSTVDAAVLYVSNVTASTSWLICYIDSGGFPKVTDGGDLNINWNAEGILNLT